MARDLTQSLSMLNVIHSDRWTDVSELPASVWVHLTTRLHKLLGTYTPMAAPLNGVRLYTA
ncbi:MAG: uncharacterized protein KVP18_001304 [Porospora cf. gigantea A]|uniref:uncharacterized protein n=1 Tax=Porospora cf. gigantea A TaxID=2853593 RepID=UPI00355AB625|nr:MAG: hypothetical protein KVP18_001304 [Porospora cf. gigantea A]